MFGLLGIFKKKLNKILALQNIPVVETEKIKEFSYVDETKQTWQLNAKYLTLILKQTQHKWKLQTLLLVVHML